jgi:hypothetical protein
MPRKRRVFHFASCITRYHVHLPGMRDLSHFMQQLQGEFAEYLNIREG